MMRVLEERNWISIVIALLIMSFIFYMSSKESDPAPSIGFKYKAVIYHFGIFFLLAFFVMTGLSKGKNYDFVVFGLLFTIFYAFTDEFHQSFVPGRDATLFDALTDSLGALVSFVVYSLRIKLRKV